MTGSELLPMAFAEAAKPGPERAPQALLTVTYGHDDPLRGLVQMDFGNEAFGAIHNEFGFVRTSKITGKPLSADDFDQLVGLLRWLIREFHEWRESDDLQFKKLTALFVTARVCEGDAAIWEIFPGGLEDNSDLLNVLERLVGKLSMAFTTRGHMSAPIWESEAVERFARADEGGDWAAIADGWRLIEHTILPTVVITQPVQILRRFGSSHLLRAVADIKQTFVGMAVADAISPAQALEIAVATDNPYFQFAATYQAVSGRRIGAALDAAGQELLTRLLVKVAQDAPRWAAWMQVFNQFPTRFPGFQPALGRALAVVDDAVLPVYVDAISLHWAGYEPRRSVAECLRAFRADAAAERRKALWCLLHRRWELWRFGAEDDRAHLMQIGYSTLDYGVVGYAVECLDEGRRQATLENLTQSLRVIEDTWRADITDCFSEWNRLLSAFQPFAHAESINDTATDWLTEERQYLPFDPQEHRYVSLKFGTGQIAVRPVDANVG